MNDSIKRLEPVIRIETPIGAIESDSGNHITDGITVVIIMVLIYTGKKIVDKLFRKGK